MVWRSLIASVSAAGLAAAALLGPVAADASAISHKPRVPANATHAGNLGWASSNWSGYAVASAGTPFTSITGTWRVPSVSATKTASYSSNWIGIDGFNNSSLIQTGTESDYYNRAAHYAVWWEILPAAETPITTMTVSPGDLINASISRGAGGVWTITIADATTGAKSTTTHAYSGPLTSAEWIEEAPSIGGRVATLAHYGSATFDPGTVNGASPGLTASDGGAMVQHGVQVSTPSAPDPAKDGFSVSYGSTAPAAPTT
ncbi:hypothetical protein LK09_06450 [Microbacterium mangrovi]|uniref:Peptidase A4 family protein n=1 Tax=Microbacterium mangrovi TaxID=1348253 RepID=A0A0B2AAE9_9MICO|nr:G1 family glutamic endopeptidase [Microbacterium mangrovi]KHK98596.1 hypothetical protein LK09_06450 [Microbacterium mangrovi]